MVELAPFIFALVSRRCHKCRIVQGGLHLRCWCQDIQGALKLVVMVQSIDLWRRLRLFAPRLREISFAGGGPPQCSTPPSLATRRSLLALAKIPLGGSLGRVGLRYTTHQDLCMVGSAEPMLDDQLPCLSWPSPLAFLHAR